MVFADHKSVMEVAPRSCFVAILGYKATPGLQRAAQEGLAGVLIVRADCHGHVGCDLVRVGLAPLQKSVGLLCDYASCGRLIGAPAYCRLSELLTVDHADDMVQVGVVFLWWARASAVARVRRVRVVVVHRRRVGRRGVDQVADAVPAAERCLGHGH